MSREDLLQQALARYRTVYGPVPADIVAAAAPGRVNLIGEHTDYTGGFVLPIAIDRYVLVVAASAPTERVIAVYADHFGELLTFPVAERPPERALSGWGRYVEGVVRELQAAGLRVPPARLVVVADLPVGAGLSSSAAIEVAVALAVLALTGETLPPPRLGMLCQQAEHRWAGVACGIMDQFAVMLARPGHALWLDTRTWQYRHVPLDPAVRIVVVHSGIDRTLGRSAYGLRRRECEEGFARLSARIPDLVDLRDVTPAMLAEHWAELPEPIGRRVRHVVTENARVQRAVHALETGALETVGQLMNESHTSLRDDFAVSCPELDALVETTRQVPGVLGSRLTGAGFGGCTVSLVRADAVEAVVTLVPSAYQARTGQRATVWVTEPVGAASTMARVP